MINGSSPSTQMFVHGGFKMAKDTYSPKWSLLRYVPNMYTCSATIGFIIIVIGYVLESNSVT
jgi:hypothetical protein